MAVRPASLAPPPSSTTGTSSPRSSSSSASRPRPPRATSFSASLPAVGLSSTTVRSSSTSRLPGRALADEGPAGFPGPPAYRPPTEDRLAEVLARRRASGDPGAPVRGGGGRGRDRARRATAGGGGGGGGGRGEEKGKGKAVAFVVGLPSSGDEGDVEREEGDEVEGAGDEVGEMGGRGREVTVEEIIQFQIPQPIRTVDSLDLDSLLDRGIADYTYVSPPPSSSSSAQPSASYPDSPRLVEEESKRWLLGKGKFSEVLLVRKGETEYALKHTPLHPHHPLIAARLLREPTILAKLLPHKNLVKVFETIRTPGSFYLVEESLRTSVTLEALVSSSPGGVLPTEQAWSVLQQLSSVVRSLHEPLRVCHRDIKPENVLVRVTPPPPSAPPNSPPTLLLKLLDFGLATHFSSAEPKLTTCCGSPAYHSPELWRSLRETAGSVTYWGPEIDIWCLGLTVLRCVRPEKYPLGPSHSSLQSMSDKVVDALLAVPDPHLRQVLAGFLNLDGRKRMRAFERFCRGIEERQRASGQHTVPVQEEDPPKPREFKRTTFLPSPVEHRLPLYLDEASSTRTEGPKLEAKVVTPEEEEGWQSASRAASMSRTPTVLEPTVSPTTVIATGLPRALDDSPDVPQQDEDESPLASASTSSATLPSVPPTPDLSPYPHAKVGLYPSSSDSLASSTYSPFSHSVESLSFRHPSLPPPVELTLLNPTDEPILRAVSYIKYALRCSGILYHVRDDSTSSSLRSSFASPGSAPPSLPPTPYIQTFPSLPPLSSGTAGFPFPAAHPPEDVDDLSYISYLHCVLALPPTSDPSASPTTASTALRAALEGRDSSPRLPRPTLPPRAKSLATLGGHQRSASTPPDRTSASDQTAGRKDQKKKELVQALTFFLSIRKAVSPAPSSPYTSSSASAHRRSGSVTPLASFPAAFTPRRPSSARRRTSSRTQPPPPSSSRILLTLSDPRALPFVRAALDLPDVVEPVSVPGESAAPPPHPQTQGEGRGRSRFGGAGRSGPLSPRRTEDNSGSRDARARRMERLGSGNGGGEYGRRSKSVDVRRTGLGLGMEMGPPSSAAGASAEEKGRRRTSSLWDFDLAGLVSRFVGGTKEASASTETSLDRASSAGSARSGEGRQGRGRGRVKASVEAAAGVL
ncbi:hypothetical protein JCM8097_001150 [Rhodosporidiobolus ruineniae]